ncbi:hypothetical protein RFI_01132 [Reticulomyxa filosa]|uniref:Uncharacterized protein n=1 Tax=Reticulomyxa filosa TaxID=46433 RepID=X6PCL3_RETFI|nr:hypothetical protein RFI_01132 [Reticulomyxa filosa]|eukprot:ETO35926.1 hypothetical protein RFI_01132 [Reticulomyxa filosa]
MSHQIILWVGSIKLGKKFTRGEYLMDHKVSRPIKDEKMTNEEFKKMSRALLDHIYEGIKNLPEVNGSENVSIEYYRNNTKTDKNEDSHVVKDEKIMNINVTEIGSYQIIINDTKKEIHMFSPISFTHHYIWDESLEQWRSKLDGHYLLELLARELNDHCQGFINW